MAKDADQLVVAANGAINVADVGSTVVEDPDAALGSSWYDLGYASEEGVTFGDAPDLETIMAWQSPDPLRRLVTGRSRTISFELHQWNDRSFPLAFGGGDWAADGSGIWRFDPPAAADALDEKAIAIDWADGDRHFRFVGYRGNVTGGVETQLTRTGSAVLPITFELLAPDDGGLAFNIWSDDPVFAAGGS